MTAYRQQALACAAALSRGPQRPRDLRPDIPDAPKILQHNVYGWFDRAERGIYVLTEAGQAALRRWPQPSTDLADADKPCRRADRQSDGADLGGSQMRRSSRRKS